MIYGLCELQWLKKTRRKALLASLEKIKEELMLLGLISLLLGQWARVISQICVDSSLFSSKFFQCSKEDYESGKFSVFTRFSSFSNESDIPPEGLHAQPHHQCGEGREPFVSYEGLEQLHRFLFVLGITHVLYSCITVGLAMSKIYSWRKWEYQASVLAAENLQEIIHQSLDIAEEAPKKKAPTKRTAASPLPQRANKKRLERLEIDANSRFMVTYNSDNDIVEVICAMYGSSLESHSTNISSIWCHILREIQSLTLKGFDFLSHCKIRVGNGHNTRFWLDKWVSDIPLYVRFPRIFALELVQGSSIAAKWEAITFDASFRRHIRDGAKRHQWLKLLSLLDSVVLSSSADRWFCDLRGDGDFRVKEIRTAIDDLHLPFVGAATRWVKYVPIKVNIFAWRAHLDRLPTRASKDESSESDDESSESDEEGGESDEDEETTPVENKNCKVDKFWSMSPLLKTSVLDIKKKEVMSDNSRIYRGKEIMTDMKARFKIDISYSQA
nr:MLO-like protein 4 [Tanacetum cinerariifolium]